MATRHVTPSVNIQPRRDSPLPPQLGHVVGAIEKSREMLDLPDNWDDEGSPAYDEATWRRAITFLVSNMFGFWQEHGVFPEVPTIDQGPLGSIDLHWQTPTRELLINVPVATDEPIDFYGDDGHDGHQVKGMLDPDETGLWLLRWLTT